MQAYAPRTSDAAERDAICRAATKIAVFRRYSFINIT